MDQSTHGEQVELFAATEFFPDEKPEERIDVVIHELCHFLFDQVSVDKTIQLQNAFLADGRPTLMPAYNLMNEALATALGNGIVTKLFMKKEAWDKYAAKPQSFYNNESIDLAGKQIIPLLETWLKEGKTIYDKAFVRDYISTLEKAFGPALTSPSLYLSEMVFQASGQFEKPFRKYVRRTLKVASMWASQGDWEPGVDTFTKQPKLNALFIVHPSEIKLLEKYKILPSKEVERIDDAYDKDGSVLYSYQRSTGVFVFVVIEKTYASAVKLLDKLAALKSGFNGVYAEATKN